MDEEKGKKPTPRLSEEEIDDLLYFARTGDASEFHALKDELCKRESANESQLLEVARDEESGNGILHMAAANGHSGTSPFFSSSLSSVKHLRTKRQEVTNSNRSPPRPSQIPLRPNRAPKSNNVKDLKCAE